MNSVRHITWMGSVTQPDEGIDAVLELLVKLGLGVWELKA